MRYCHCLRSLLLSFLESLFEKLVDGVTAITVQDIFFSLLISATHVFSLDLSPTQLLLFLLFRLLLLSPLRLSHSVTHQSSATFIFLPNPNPTKQTFVFPPQSQNLRLSSNHFSLLFCSQPHNVSSKP